MSKATQILEALYKVYNKEEEIAEYGEEKPEYRTADDAESLRRQFIGTIMSGDSENTLQNLKACIDKMPDEWVAQFLEVINGDTIEKVNEDLQQLKYFTFKKENLKSKEDFQKAQEEMKKALREEPNMDAQQIIKKDMETLKSWEQELNKDNNVEKVSESLYADKIDFDPEEINKIIKDGYRDLDSVITVIKDFQKRNYLGNKNTAQLITGLSYMCNNSFGGGDVVGVFKTAIKNCINQITNIVSRNEQEIQAEKDAEKAKNSYYDRLRANRLMDGTSID